MEQITSSYVKDALDEVIGGHEEDTGKEDDSMSDASSSDDGEDSAPAKGKRKHRKHGHWKKEKKEKREKKDKHEGLPRKAFKKLIRKELDKQCHQIFENLFNGQNTEAAQQEPATE